MQISGGARTTTMGCTSSVCERDYSWNEKQLFLRDAATLAETRGATATRQEVPTPSESAVAEIWRCVSKCRF